MRRRKMSGRNNEKEHAGRTGTGFRTFVRAMALMLVLALNVMMFTGCAKEEENTADDTDLFEAVLNPEGSTWGSTGGDILRLLPAENAYILKRDTGRVGRGDFYPDDKFISFNGLLYEISMTDQNNFYLIQNGDSTEADFESIDGMSFGITDDDSFWAYDTPDLHGTWIDEDGSNLTLDMDIMEYTVYYEDGFASGTINDDQDGRGLFLSMSDNAYIILKDDGTLTFDTSEEDFAGKTYVRQE